MCHLRFFLGGGQSDNNLNTDSMQAPFQYKMQLDQTSKKACVPSGRKGQWDTVRGLRSLFPGGQKIGDMWAAIQTKNQQKGVGDNIPGRVNNQDTKVGMSLVCPQEQRKPRQQGLEARRLQEMPIGLGNPGRPSQSRAKGRAPHPALKPVSKAKSFWPGQVDSEGSFKHGAKTGAHASSTLLPVDLRWFLALVASSLSSKKSRCTFSLPASQLGDTAH